MRRRLNTGETGISLIEVVVAVLVLSLGVIAGFTALGQARLAIGGEAPRLLARQVALNRAEELQIQGAGAAAALPATVRAGGIDWQVAAETTPTEAGFVEVRLRVGAEGQPGATVVVYAPPGPPR